MSENTTSPLYLVCAYFIVAGISFLLSPILAYLLFMAGLLLVGIGFIIDIILCLLLWWAGFEGGIGMAIMHAIDVPQPLTAWIVFMVLFTLVYILIFAGCLENNKSVKINVPPSQKPANNYPVTSPEQERASKMRSLRIRASIDLTPKIKKLRKQFKNGEISKKDVTDSLYSDFNIWVKDFDLSKYECDEIWQSIYDKVRFI